MAFLFWVITMEVLHLTAFSIKHDLHCHSILSMCSSDELMNFPAIVAHAEQSGYDTVCLTNHLWDGDRYAPGIYDWYAAQDISHIQKALPRPESKSVRVLFGCETEYCGGAKIGLNKMHHDLFDFIVVPLTHMHLIGFVRPKEIDTEQKMAELLIERMEEIQVLDLPWHKVGIAHSTCSLIFTQGDVVKVFDAMDEDRLYRALHGFAKKGVGIELNACDFVNWQNSPESFLKQYRIAKAAGCKFYCASDAHTRESMDTIDLTLPDVVSALELTENDRYIVPNRT